MKKNHYIFMTKVYKFFSIALLVSILFLGVLYKSVNGQNKCEEVKNTKIEILNPNVVFLGDSITDYYDLDKYYPKLKKVNSGISGNKIIDIKNDMYNRVYRYNPSKVVLLIGINDILHNKETDYLLEDIKIITSNIKKNFPNCEIYIESIYPINEVCENKYSIVFDTKRTNEIVVEYNNEIKKICNKKSYTYIDMFKELSDESNMFSREYTDDGLHPNENGYNKITEVLKEYL